MKRKVTSLEADLYKAERLLTDFVWGQKPYRRPKIDEEKLRGECEQFVWHLWQTQYDRSWCSRRLEAFYRTKYGKKVDRWLDANLVSATFLSDKVRWKLMRILHQSD